MQVAALRKLHEERVRLDQEFEKEREALCRKFMALEAPLHDSRRQILVPVTKSPQLR